EYVSTENILRQPGSTIENIFHRLQREYILHDEIYRVGTTPIAGQIRPLVVQHFPCILQILRIVRHDTTDYAGPQFQQ
ncbi:hypothetical protein L916_21613, partial [Phytophthora nicotianae]